MIKNQKIWRYIPLKYLILILLLTGLIIFLYIYRSRTGSNTYSASTSQISPMSSGRHCIRAGDSNDDITPYDLFKERYEYVDYISDFVVSCNKLKMDIWGVHDDVKCFIGAIPINTGRRSMSKSLMDYQGITKPDEEIGPDGQKQPNPVTISGQLWYIFNSINEQISYVHNCLPADVSGSNTTPIGNYKIENIQHSDTGEYHSTIPPYNSMGHTRFKFHSTRSLYMHGGQSVYDRSEGCIHVQDMFIDLIWPKVKQSTVVTISDYKDADVLYATPTLLPEAE